MIEELSSRLRGLTRISEWKGNIIYLYDGPVVARIILGRFFGSVRRTWYFLSEACNL